MEERAGVLKESGVEREYIAFISYRHKPLDSKVAKTVQQRIERYTVPKEYREKAGIHPGIVFRDEDELPISSSLSDSIIYALDHSQFLIVICTKSLRESKWCEAEIDYFIKKNGRDRVIAVLAEGTPDESFPPQLLHTFDENGTITGDLEPLAANIAGDVPNINKKAVSKETTRIIAALLGCPFDALWQREKRRKTNRILTICGIGAVILAVFLVLMIRKNAQISEQNQKLQRQLSSALVDNGRAKLERHDVQGALKDGLDALLEEDDDAVELYDHRVEGLLNDALGAYQNEVLRSSVLYEQSSDIAFLTVSADGRFVYLSDREGVVNCVDIETGTLCWTVSTAAPDQKPSRNNPALFVLEEQGILICKNTSNIEAVSLENGETLWEYKYNSYGGNNFRGVSPDGDLFMIMDGEEPDDDPNILYALDTRSGQVMGQIDLSSSEYEIDLDSWTDWYRCGCIFSEDGSRIVVALYEDVLNGENRDIVDYQCMFFLIDPENWEVLHSGWIDGLPHNSAGIIYGMHLMPQSDNLFCAVYTEGLIDTSIFNWEDMTYTGEFTNQTISSLYGYNTGADRYTVQPMLANDDLVIVFSDNAMFFFDRNDDTLIKSFKMQGTILNAWWGDEEEKTVAFLMDNGQIGFILLENLAEGREACSVTTYDQDDILLAAPVNGGICTDPINGMYLTVSKNDPGLLQVRQITDPGLEYLSIPENASAVKLSVQAAPSGDRVMIFYPMLWENQLIVITYDTETGDEINRCSFETESDYPCTVLNDTHFISGCKIYDLESENYEYLEGLSEDSQVTAYEDHFCSIRLADGSVLTTEDLADKSGGLQFIDDGDTIHVYVSEDDVDYGLCSCWLNGKLVSEFASEDTGLVLPSESDYLISPLEHSAFMAGANGWILAHGMPGQSDLEGAGDGFIVFHATDPTRRFIEDPYPQDEKKIITIGTEKPVFACAYSDGQILLFDMSTGSYQILDTGYSPGEIQSLCFSEGDEYLLVLTMSTRLDVYDLSDGSLRMSEVLQEIKAENEQENTTYGAFTSLSCMADKERDKLHVFASKDDETAHYWNCIDTNAWVITAHAGNIYTWIRDNESLYGFKVESERAPVIFKYHAYSIQDLADWARRELE